MEEGLLGNIGLLGKIKGHLEEKMGGMIVLWQCLFRWFPVLTSHLRWQESIFSGYRTLREGIYNLWIILGGSAFRQIRGVQKKWNSSQWYILDSFALNLQLVSVCRILYCLYKRESWQIHKITWGVISKDGRPLILPQLLQREVKATEISLKPSSKYLEGQIRDACH